MCDDEISVVNNEMKEIYNLFRNVIEIIPSFNVLDSKILPYGLKPHTRSVSWLSEQVIVQQAKYNAKKLQINDLDFDLPDTSLHDCVVHKDSKEYFVNIKISSAGKKQNKNDISAVEKLYMQYRANTDYRLMFVVFGFSFDNTTLHFDKEEVHVFSPQFLPIYVNPRNDKIQAYYHAEKIERSRDDFLSLLEKESTSIKLQK